MRNKRWAVQNQGITLIRDGPLEKLWGEGGGELLSRRNVFSLSNSLYQFCFRP